MANSRFEYVRKAERDTFLTEQAYIVVRVDGHSFHRFSQVHEFRRPNDLRSLNLMNRAARAVMDRFSDITLAFGSSDEFSFLFKRNYDLYERRENKLTSLLVSLFTASYCFHWPEYFGSTERPKYAPSFDARAVPYATEQQVKDYFAWRQADAHINNLYNTTFWALQQNLPIRASRPSAKKNAEITTDETSPGQMDEARLLNNREAEQKLLKTLAKDKNEILWQRGINYNDEPAIYKKGSILVYQERSESAETQFTDLAINGLNTSGVEQNLTQETSRSTKQRGRRRKKVTLELVHVDLIGEAFWQSHPDILQS